MAWLQATIDTDSAVAERLADALMDAGALSTAIEDAWPVPTWNSPSLANRACRWTSCGTTAASSPCLPKMPTWPC
jgi:ribosomal protein L11 methylase PrmA